MGKSGVQKNKMKCYYCSKEFKSESKQGFNALIKHFLNVHAEILTEEQKEIYMRAIKAVD